MKQKLLQVSNGDFQVTFENFPGEIQTKKFTAVPLAAWDGGFLSFFKIASQ